MPKPATTVLYSHGGGRFGNQFLRFAHWLAWAIEQQGRSEIIDLAFWPYAVLFEVWAKHPGCVYPLRSGWIHTAARIRGRLPSRVLRHGEWRMQRCVAGIAGVCPGVRAVAVQDGAGERVDLASPEFQRKLRSGAALVCSGWHLSAWAALERNEAAVRRLLVPAAEIRGAVTRWIGRLRANSELLIGLLIRRGDYREWGDGRYFFSWETYVRWTRELVACFPGRKVCVVLAGDEAIPIDLWSGLPAVLATGSVNGAGHWFESFLALAACDFVVSAPSTFSGCAAFLGDRPLWPLRSADQILSTEQIMAHHLFSAAGDPDFSMAVR